MDKKRMNSIIARFNEASVLVIGDLMLDEFVWGKVTRISPEAPVPVVDVTSITFSPGGAGNVVNNIRVLGGKVYPVGIVGEDGTAQKLIAELKKKGIDIDGIVVDSERPTTLKSRVIAHSQQILRIDREQRGEIHEWVVKQMLSYIKMLLPEIKAVVVSDYGKGVISPRLLEELIPLCRKNSLPIIVDPKVNHSLHYKGISVITPNHHEAGELIHQKITDEETLLLAGQKILSELENEAVLITRGEDGMSLFEKDGSITHIPTVAKEVYDVTGAGDTVVSVLSLSLACGAKMKDASALSNFAAGIVVEKVGTAVVTALELKERINGAYE
ncbi:MAG: D-glycero-beta-D-manno-heptose-7-phosphate kinase [bacterium]|nr:D-glycero-beta-D-manno-heptose-7-phosphate kinase [bacterium]